MRCTNEKPQISEQKLTSGAVCLSPVLQLLPLTADEIFPPRFRSSRYSWHELTSHPVQEAVAESESGQMKLCGKAASDHECVIAMMSAFPTLTKAGQQFLIHQKCPCLRQKASAPPIMRSELTTGVNEVLPLFNPVTRVHHRYLTHACSNWFYRLNCVTWPQILNRSCTRWSVGIFLLGFRTKLRFFCCFLLTEMRKMSGWSGQKNDFTVHINVHFIRMLYILCHYLLTGVKGNHYSAIIWETHFHHQLPVH